MAATADNSTHRPAALVTGSGADRIGRAVARGLAERNYAVALHANRSVGEAAATAEAWRRAGKSVIAVGGDLRDEAVVRRIVDEVRAAFGRIDVLVNCAAIWKSKPLEQVVAADVVEHFEVNALGTFLCCRHVGLVMTEQEQGGAIVNVGDWATHRPYCGYAAYFPSKGAIPAMTRMFAVELARRNPKVRVNAVLPGPVMLPADLPESECREAISGTLVRSEGTPEHVVQAVLALVENTFITGVCLPVDGGRTIAP